MILSITNTKEKKNTMIRIRIQDSDVIQYLDKQFSFNKQNRHGSSVTSFKINGGKIEYFDAILETKMIPKKHVDCFNNIPFKMLKTDSKHSILFQDPNNTLQFLTYNDGWIQSTKFDDLTEDDDIIIFDENENEWALSGITEIKYYNTDFEKEEEHESTELLLTMFDGLSKSLSPYMIKLDSGMIVNNIFII